MDFSKLIIPWAQGENSDELMESDKISQENLWNITRKL